MKTDKKGRIGIGTSTPVPEHQITISCKCGNESFIDIDFEINIIGMLEFKCNECGFIQDTGGSIRNNGNYKTKGIQD